MKRITVLFIIVLLFGSFAGAQEYTKVNFIEEIKKYDLSILWSPDIMMLTEDEEGEGFSEFARPEPIGFIGDDLQRFYIHFVSVVQNNDNPFEYLVYGKTKVKDNICDFQGIITVKEAAMYRETLDNEHSEGSVWGDYLFYEDKKQKGTGFFKGKLITDFALDKDDKLHYNALWLISDGYCNNLFEGTWVSYTNSSVKKCNWGDFRIPDNMDLDRGAGEFYPAEKYYSKGWENYQYLFDNTPEGEKARSLEKVKWWE